MLRTGMSSHEGVLVCWLCFACVLICFANLFAWVVLLLFDFEGVLLLSFLICVTCCLW